MSEWLFWISLIAIVYVYVGYPLLLLVRAARVKPVYRSEVAPRVSMVIVAHNEAATIRDKLDNTLALRYPSDKLEVVVASDGSDDGSDEIVTQYKDRGVRLLACPRRGKIPALNDAVAQCTGEILVFSDANSMYDREALQMLVRSFADPEVGAVAGNQCYLAGKQGGTASAGERLYWNFDRALKALQSRAGSIIGATGAMHAIRRELFAPVPLGVCDDFTISTRAIRQGRRLVFEPHAIAREPVASSDNAEFRRKMRIAARGLRTMWAVRELFNPVRHGFYSVQILSHKLLRWSVCWMLPVLLASSLALYDAGAVYRLAALGQVAFYIAALGGLLLQGASAARSIPFKALTAPYYFCFVNAAAFCAWLQVLRGRRVDLWSSPRQDLRPTLESGLGAERVS